jgi:hypothetical protein
MAGLAFPAASAGHLFNMLAGAAVASQGERRAVVSMAVETARIMIQLGAMQLPTVVLVGAVAVMLHLVVMAVMGQMAWSSYVI